MKKSVNVEFKERRICIGDFNTKITIQIKCQESTNKLNQALEITRIDSVTVWSAVKTVAGVETLEDINSEEIITHQFYIRYRKDIDKSSVVILKEIAFNIISIENLEEKNKYLLLRCAQGGNANIQTNLI